VSRRSRKKRLRKKSVSAQVDSSSRQSKSLRNQKIVRTDDFQPDYSYVVNDLKRIGVLAGSLVTLLIILSFFLR
jgi:hypothetical protein